MKYLIVYAHPEPASLNGFLRDHALAALRDAGHQVALSDLYAMRWKATADALDFPARDPEQPLDYSRASGEAYRAGQQSPEVAEEQRKTEGSVHRVQVTLVGNRGVLLRAPREP